MRKFGRSLGYAWSGVLFALRTQSHMRFHLAAGLLVVLVGLPAGLSALEWAVLLLAIAAVMGAEMINTAVEQTVDLASPNIHPLAKAAKDTAAGAVLIVSAVAVIIGIIILGPPIWRLLAS